MNAPGCEGGIAGPGAREGAPLKEGIGGPSPPPIQDLSGGTRGHLRDSSEKDLLHRENTTFACPEDGIEIPQRVKSPGAEINVTKPPRRCEVDV